jgi:predicted GIY-YIG superfamily endonuclease
MARFFYVYILKSRVDPERFYSGLTGDLPMRLSVTIQGKFSRVRRSADLAKPDMLVSPSNATSYDSARKFLCDHDHALPKKR